MRRIAAERRAKLKGKVEVIYCRVMLLGPGGVGKTSLKRGLMGLKIDDKANSTIVAEVHSLTVKKRRGTGLEEVPEDPLEREWVKGGLVGNEWCEVTEEDEINELAQLIAYVVDTEDSDYEEQKVSEDLGVTEERCKAIQLLTDSKVLNEAFKRAKKMKSDDMPKPKSSPFYHLWDCGGQPVFQEVLPAFLTPRTMFLLLFNAAKNLNMNIESVQYSEGREIKRGIVNMTTLQLLEGWMSSIHSYLLEKDRSGCLKEYPRVIPVGTRGDQLTDESKKQLKDYLMKSSYDKIFSEVLKQPVIIDNTSAGKGEGEDPVYQVLRNAISNFATRRLAKETPITWVLYRKVLQLITSEDSDTNTITFDEATAIGIVCNIAPEEIPEVLMFYHDLGVLLYYPEIVGLRDTIILNPKWFVDCLGMVLTLPGVGKEETERQRQWDLFRSTGILVQKLYAAVWKECKGVEPEDMIKLLAKFQLAVKVETELYYGQKDPQYFVPAVLPYFKTDPDHLTRDHIKGPAPLHIRFESGYVTPGFFTRFVTEFAKGPKCKLYFDEGIYHNRVTYRFGDTAANLVTFTELLNVIEVCVERLGPDYMHSELQKDCLELKSLCETCSVSVENNLPSKIKDHSSKVPKVLCRNPECLASGQQLLHYLEPNLIKAEVSCSNDIKTYRRITRREAYWYKDADMSEFKHMNSTSSGDGLEENDIAILKPESIEVFRLLKSKAYKWYDIGRELNIPYPFRESLRREGVVNTDEEKLEKIIVKWVESECLEVSWDSLIKVLKMLEFAELVRNVKTYLKTDPEAIKKYNWEDTPISQNAPFGNDVEDTSTSQNAPLGAQVEETYAAHSSSSDDEFFDAEEEIEPAVKPVMGSSPTALTSQSSRRNPEQSDVYQLLKHQSSLWNDFGRELEIEQDIIENILKEKHTDDVKLDLVIGFWLELSSNPSWDELLRVLEKLKLVNCMDEVKRYLVTDNQAIAKYKWKASIADSFH